MTTDPAGKDNRAVGASHVVLADQRLRKMPTTRATPQSRQRSRTRIRKID